SCVLAETLGSIGATVHGAPDRVGVGVDINATHHRPITSGWVTATATAIRLGRTVASYEIVITDDADRRICTARITCQLIPRPSPARWRDCASMGRLGKDFQHPFDLSRRVDEHEPEHRLALPAGGHAEDPALVGQGDRPAVII